MPAKQDYHLPILQSPAVLKGVALQVKSTRKGLTNQLKTLLWRKPLTGTAVSIQGRDSPLSGSVHGGSVHGGAANGGLTAYSGASIESQMRSLADLAFLMQVGQTHGMVLLLMIMWCSLLQVRYAGCQILPRLSSLCVCPLTTLRHTPTDEVHARMLRSLSAGGMQDYEMALSTLRLLCSDLKTDKRWRQYAGAQVYFISPFRPCMLSM